MTICYHGLYLHQQTTSSVTDRRIQINMEITYQSQLIMDMWPQERSLDTQSKNEKAMVMKS